VLTVQETPRDCLDPLRARIRDGRKLVRSSGTDYLTCMVIDAIVDGYFPLLERFGEELEELETDVLGGREPDAAVEAYGQAIHHAPADEAQWLLARLQKHLRPRLEQDTGFTWSWQFLSARDVGQVERMMADRPDPR